MNPVSDIILLGSLQTEFKTIKAMVEIYCKDHHHPKESEDTMCENCQAFLDYAEMRLDRCPYGDEKPTCRVCPIHCYKKEQRELSRTIMRYSGPKMLLKHPILAIRHLLSEKRPIPEQIPENNTNRFKRKQQEKSNTMNKRAD
ncbi:TPA: nitrous oxide-stimulated promoter family protein [Photobacterium damselae]